MRPSSVIAVVTLAFVFGRALAASTESDQISGQIPNHRSCVVLLHGLARTSLSMRKMAAALSESGYRVLNFGYRSRTDTVANLARAVIPAAIEQCDGPGRQPIHFVTHSMGGILVRYYLENNRLESLGRTVMLSPPNHGSELVDRLARMPGFRLINGPAGRQLGTRPNSVPSQLGAPDFVVGIIAGSRSLNPIYSLMIPGDDDGKISIEHTRLDGMTDFLVVPHSHTWIMNSELVIEQVHHFLKFGRFSEI